MTRSCPRRRSRRVSWPFLIATPLWGRRGLTGPSRQARIARDGCVLGREPRALPDRVDLEGGGTGPGGGSAVAGRGAALRGDQPIEPGDLTFVLVQTVVHQLEGVRVEPVADGAQRGAQVAEPVLQVTEEGQAHREAVLLEVMDVGGFEQLEEELLAALGQPVDVLLAGGEAVLLDLERAVREEPLEAWVQ